MHLDPTLLVRRTRGCYLLAAILLLGGTGLFTPQAATGAPPNILWITVEDMSPRLGCYGDHTVPTPNIDQLATEAVRYTRAFGVYGVCSPNRHTLILGMYPTSTGAMAMRTWKRTAALDQDQRSRNCWPSRLTKLRRHRSRSLFYPVPADPVAIIVHEQRENGLPVSRPNYRLGREQQHRSLAQPPHPRNPFFLCF